jgi:acyl-coenzyme A thioesterase 9
MATAATMAWRGASSSRLLSTVGSSSPVSVTSKSKVPRLFRGVLPPSGVLTASRNLHGTAVRQTDGVFSGLTDHRDRIPWIEAFKEQQREQEGKGASSGDRAHRKIERDMTPKKMSDSYHRVILPLGRDPSLSDTYINSSGHIR